jgi:TolB-like protein
VPPRRWPPSQSTKRSKEPELSIRQWPCLLPSISVAVAPLRNLTGDPEQQTLVEGFSEGVLANLCRHCRGFTFVSTAGDRDLTAKLASLNPLEPKYVVSGSVQRGSRHGMLRANIRVSDAVTGNYLWAGREEFWVEHLEPIQTELVRQISRVLHILFLHDVSYRASMTSDAELGVTECLARAVNALKGKLCAEFSAEAQQWFLAALACDPRNVEALVGVALTCQHLASNPWWGDPLGAAAASDLGREAVAVALELQPGHALAHCVQGMLYSAVGELEQAEAAFRLTLAIDPGLGSAHAFLGYNRALLGNAGETLPAIERAMRLDPTDRHHSIWLFFGGFAELLVGQTEAAIALFRRSLARNPTYGSAELFLIVALSLIGRHRDAVLIAESFRQQYSESPVDAFERLWLSRSASPVYRAQVFPLFEKIQMLSAAA